MKKYVLAKPLEVVQKARGDLRIFTIVFLCLKNIFMEHVFETVLSTFCSREPHIPIPPDMKSHTRIRSLQSHLLQVHNVSIFKHYCLKHCSLRTWFYGDDTITVQRITALRNAKLCSKTEYECMLRVRECVIASPNARQNFFHAMELGFHPFVIISAAYNNEQFLKQYMSKIVQQRYIFYRVIYTDDSSSDNSVTTLLKTIPKDHQQRWTIQQNASRCFQAYAKREAYMKADDDEICVFVDGDDHLNNICVLELLDAVYQETRTQMTTGSYCIHYNNEIVTLPNTIATYTQPSYTTIQTAPRHRRTWKYSHLRTGRARLFKSIPVSYLQDPDGEWLQFATDVAEMYWALDQCASHVHIHNILLNYNKTNSIRYEQSYYNSKDSKKREHIIEHIRLSKPAPVSALSSTGLYEAQTPTITEPVFVINLERRKDRARTMIKTFARYNIRTTLWPAIDGQSESIQNVYHNYLECTKKNKKRYLTAGAFGLMCSYTKLLHHCLKHRYAYVYIFEDDVRMHKHFDKEIHRAPGLLGEFDVVLLGANQQKWEGISIDTDRGLYAITGDRRTWTYGMFGVLLSRRAMKKFYAKLMSVPLWKHEYPIDCMMNQLLADTSLEGCVLYPNIVIADLTDSDLREARDMDKWSAILRWNLVDYNLKI